MIISRTLARKRIARSVRPSFRAAWAPVAADVVLIFVFLAVIFLPVVSFSIALDLSLPWRMVFLLIVIYGPFQIVVVISTIWAIRSRWKEDDSG